MKRHIPILIASIIQLFFVCTRASAGALIPMTAGGHGDCYPKLLMFNNDGKGNSCLTRTNLMHHGCA